MVRASRTITKEGPPHTLCICNGPSTLCLDDPPIARVVVLLDDGIVLMNGESIHLVDNASPAIDESNGEHAVLLYYDVLYYTLTKEGHYILLRNALLMANSSR